MGCCAALNCSNSSEKNFRMFRFPSDPERRKQWIKNCRREGWTPGPNAQLCCIHFEESQFELHRQDGWKKLKPNAIPTLFPEPVDVPKVKKERSPRKSKRSPSEETEILPKRKYSRRNVPSRANSPKKRLHRKAKSESLQKKKYGSSNNSQGSQKENVSPRLRKSSRPSKVVTPVVSDSSTEEEEDDSEEDAAQLKISLLKRDNESMRQEIAEFEKHNKAMTRVILELEKHNKAMSYRLQELDKDNKLMAKKISDLERQNEDLKSKLNCCFSEEQLARMDKMKQLGTIERYIPALK